MQDSQQQLIFNQITNVLYDMGKNNVLYKALSLALKRIDEAGRVNLILDATKDKESMIMGFFSSYENQLYINIYDEFYETKFLGFFTDRDKLKEDAIHNSIHILLHEMVHYVAYNNTQNYLHLWNIIQKNFLKMTFALIALYYGENLLPPQLQKMKISTPNQILKDGHFNKAFDIYYANVRQSDMITLSSLEAFYSRVVPAIYAKSDWSWARFFDNVLTTVVEIDAYGRIDNIKTFALYNSLKKTYLYNFPGIEKSRQFNSMFYQELMAPSEIACIELSSANEVKELQPLAIKTLNLA